MGLRSKKDRYYTADMWDMALDRPEHRLIMAVLIDAYRALTLAKTFGRANKERRRALAVKFWMANNEDWGPFSFVAICKTIGIAPETARNPDIIKVFQEKSKIFDRVAPGKANSPHGNQTHTLRRGFRLRMPRKLI